MALLALCMPARSQNVIMTDRMSSGGFEPIPKELANDGVAYMAVYDFHEIRMNRLSWGLFRDRRPECYSDICG